MFMNMNFWQGDDLPWGAPLHKVTSPFSHVVLWDHVTNQNYYVSTSRMPGHQNWKGDDLPQEILPLKLEFDLPKKLFYLLQWKPSKCFANAFYFILKPLFVLKILQFLAWLFDYVEKTVWFER